MVNSIVITSVINALNKTGLLLISSVLVFLLGLQTVAAKVSAHVDRNTISEIETVRLVLSSDQKSTAPNLSALEKDFDLLGTSSNSRVSIINGKMSSTYEWVTTLAPKRKGRLLIPVITLGGEKTRPIAITVKTGKVDPGVASDIFIQTSVKPKRPYVQSQLIYEIKFHHAVELLEGNLSSPEVENAVVERLGKDESYMKEIKGRRFRVTERKYAIFPQQSGPLVIPEIVFNGKIAEQRSRRSSAFDPFFSNSFQTGRTVRLRSKKQTVNVLPKPASARSGWWLPAKKLSLSESWSPQSPSFRVGEPITRTLTLTAQGLTEAQLPDLELPESNSFRLYPDKSSNETLADENTVVGRKQQKIAFVPTRAGKTTIPEIVINWWDTQKNRPRVAKIAARTINILPAIGGAGSGDIDKLSTIAANNITLGEKLSDDVNETKQKATNLFDLPVEGVIWVWLAVFFLVMWLATAAAWIYHQRRMNARSTNTGDEHQYDSSKQALYAVRQAAMHDQPKLTHDAVIAWARLAWPGVMISNIGDILKLLRDDEASQALADLDNLLYSGKPQQWTGKDFWQAFLSVETANQQSKSSPEKLIKDLYPA